MNYQAKTRQQIAAEYQVDRKTLRRWCKKHQIMLPTGLVPPKYVALIYRTLGEPPVR